MRTRGRTAGWLFRFVPRHDDCADSAFGVQFCTPPFHIAESLALGHEQAQLLSSSSNRPTILCLPYEEARWYRSFGHPKTITCNLREPACRNAVPLWPCR